MTPLNQQPQVEYGDQAVELPAEKVLEYGNKAVKQGVLVAQAASGKKPKMQSAQQTPSNLTVNSMSKIKAEKLSTILRKHTLPSTLAKNIRDDKKTSTIILPDLSQIPEAERQDWVSDLLKVASDWEFTTARLVVLVFQKDIKGQKLEPHLDAPDEARGFISVKDDDNELLPIDADFQSAGPGILLGKTVPNLRMSNRLPLTEIARLTSNRGLIIIVTEIVIKKGSLETLNPIKVPESIVDKELMHELSAHASMHTQGKPAEHGENQVDRNAKQIEDLFKKKTEKAENKLIKDVFRYIEAMKKAKEKDD